MWNLDDAALSIKHPCVDSGDWRLYQQPSGGVVSFGNRDRPFHTSTHPLTLTIVTDHHQSNSNTTSTSCQHAVLSMMPGLGSLWGQTAEGPLAFDRCQHSDVAPMDKGDEWRVPRVSRWWNKNTIKMRRNQKQQQLPTSKGGVLRVRQTTQQQDNKFDYNNMTREDTTMTRSWYSIWDLRASTSFVCKGVMIWLVA